MSTTDADVLAAMKRVFPRTLKGGVMATAIGTSVSFTGNVKTYWQYREVQRQIRGLVFTVENEVTRVRRHRAATTQPRDSYWDALPADLQDRISRTAREQHGKEQAARARARLLAAAEAAVAAGDVASQLATAVADKHEGLARIVASHVHTYQYAVRKPEYVHYKCAQFLPKHVKATLVPVLRSLCVEHAKLRMRVWQAMDACDRARVDYPRQWRTTAFNPFRDLDLPPELPDLPARLPAHYERIGTTWACGHWV